MELGGYRLEEPFFVSPTTRVFRSQSRRGEAVVVKLPVTENPRPQVIARYQRAYDLGNQADIRSVVRHLELVRYQSSVALVTEDFGGVSLASLIPKGGLPIHRLLRLGHALASALARLHDSGILHRDLTPHNVVVNPSTLDVRLIDLGLATRLTRGEGTRHGAGEFEGTLAYMSPELCGRIGCAIDDRADLYSMGTTLFEMATGRVPFEYDDASALAHAHVARPPPKIAELRNDVPAVLSDIVATLLAKNPDERYASARGLADDLERCASGLRRTGRIDHFPLRETDRGRDIRIPDRLYGRERDLERLRAAIGRLNTGDRVLVSVSGVSGIGKTALVNEIQKQVMREGGSFCSGKFDQFRPDAPYLGILQALRALLRRILASSTDVLSSIRSTLEAALGVHGRLVTEGIPELAALLGPQPEVEQVAPLDAARRFHLVVARLIGALAPAQRPLVMFVDDMQWADSPTLQLLEALADHPATAHLMFVFGFRSNEVGPGHPLRDTLATLGRAANATESFELEPLEKDDITELVADTLGASIEDSAPLAGRIHAVAAGNPLFVREFLMALWERGFFIWDEARSSWSWDVDALARHLIPDKLADLLTLRLRGLSDDCLDFLDTASCVGGEFDLQTIAKVHELPQRRVAVGLLPAVQGGLLVPLDQGHELFESLASWDLDSQSLGTARYRFRHDKVRQTVHDRLDDASRVARHLHVGRLLLRHLSEDELSHRLVEVFTHIIYGLDALKDPDERARLANLGLRAGLSAKRALAFDTAERMLRAGLSLLPENPWAENYDTARDLHLALAECAYAHKRYDDADELAVTMIQHVKDAEDAAEAHGLRIRMHTSQARYAEAVDIAIDVARSIGMKLPRKPSTAHVLRDVTLTLWAQGRADPMSYVALPKCEAPKIRVGVSLLSQAASASYFSEPNLLPLIGMSATRLSLKHGTTPYSPYAFTIWALVQCGALGRLKSGVRFGELAVEVSRRYGGFSEARARFVFNAFVRHWRDPFADCARALYGLWAQNRDAGDEEMAAYAVGAMTEAHFLAGGSLDVNERYGDALVYLRDCHQDHTRDCFLAWVELLEALRQPEIPEALAGKWYRHEESLRAFEAIKNNVQIAISSIAAGVLDHFAGRLESAAKHFARASRLKEPPRLAGERPRPRVLRSAQRRGAPASVSVTARPLARGQTAVEATRALGSRGNLQLRPLRRAASGLRILEARRARRRRPRFSPLHRSRLEGRRPLPGLGRAGPGGDLR
jgi:predicted ATPase